LAAMKRVASAAENAPKIGFRTVRKSVKVVPADPS
jgi:hypothetical protein